MDHKGDKSKQPIGCQVDLTGKCPHLKNTYEGYDSETYSCQVCGEHYKLYYDEMQ